MNHSILVQMKIAMLTKMSPERKYKLECFINCHVLINNENEGQHSECFNNMVTWSDIQLYIVQSCISYPNRKHFSLVQNSILCRHAKK